MGVSPILQMKRRSGFPSLEGQERRFFRIGRQPKKVFRIAGGMLSTAPGLRVGCPIDEVPGHQPGSIIRQACAYAWRVRPHRNAVPADPGDRRRHATRTGKRRPADRSREVREPCRSEQDQHHGQHDEDLARSEGAHGRPVSRRSRATVGAARACSAASRRGRSCSRSRRRRRSRR